MADGCTFADKTNFAAPQRWLLSWETVSANNKNKISMNSLGGFNGNHDHLEKTAAANSVYVPEYSAEIGDHFLLAERSHYRDPDYMANQPEITEKMRMILMDWLVDVVLKFRLHPESYYLAVDIVDRYLGLKKVSRGKLQLVGITAILLSAKHEEIWPPNIKDCVFICASTYTAQEIFEMERNIAIALRFRFSVPTVYPLACHFLGFDDKNPIVRQAALFFLESSSHNYEMVQYLPSRVAAASVLLARLLVAWNSYVDRSTISISNLWDYDMFHLSRGITVDEIFPVAEKLLTFTKGLLSSTSKLQAVRRKYSSKKYDSVALLDMPSLPLLLSF